MAKTNNPYTHIKPMSKMKKQLFLLCFLIVLFASCTPKNQCVISGAVTCNCDSVFIVSEHAECFSAVVPVTNGRYVWKGVADTTLNIRICTDSEQEKYCRAIMEPGKITVDIPSGGPQNTLPCGTPLNDSIAAFENARSSLQERMSANSKKRKEATEGEKEKLQEEYDQLNEDYRARLVDALAHNADNAFGVYLLFNVQHFNYPDRVEAAVMKLRDNFPDNFWTKMVGGQVEGKMRSWIGRKYTDLTMPTTEGEELSLSDVIPNHDYTFVDFWASWCGPCLFDLPYVKEAYDKYHPMGFEIVGVSLDDNAEKWKKAIAEEGLPWIHISDLKGWGSAASKLYGINAIPFSFLVDRNGTIVARDLRMTQLMDKLDELYAAKQ